MQQVSGILQAGHQVASGIAPDSPYEKGTIEIQLPFFKELGLDLSPFFRGTLNVNLAPKVFELVRSQYTFHNVKWHPDYPAEDFSFSPCQVRFQNQTYSGLVYYPHPETKIGHFQDPSVIEIIAPHISGLNYGDSLMLVLDSQEIVIK